MSGLVSYCPQSWIKFAVDRLFRFFSDLCHQGLGTEALFEYCSIREVYSQDPVLVGTQLQSMVRIRPVTSFHDKYAQGGYDR